MNYVQIEKELLAIVATDLINTHSGEVLMYKVTIDPWKQYSKKPLCCEDRLFNIFIISKNKNGKKEISWAYIQSGIQDYSIKTFYQLIINYLVTM